jgi:hypothetical protein
VQPDPTVDVAENWIAAMPRADWPWLAGAAMAAVALLVALMKRIASRRRRVRFAEPDPVYNAPMLQDPYAE